MWLVANLVAAAHGFATMLFFDEFSFVGDPLECCQGISGVGGSPTKILQSLND